MRYLEALALSLPRLSTYPPFVSLLCVLLSLLPPSQRIFQPFPPHAAYLIFVFLRENSECLPRTRTSLFRALKLLELLFYYLAVSAIMFFSFFFLVLLDAFIVSR